jgi:hypothetical protein
MSEERCQIHARACITPPGFEPLCFSARFQSLRMRNAGHVAGAEDDESFLSIEVRYEF